ncbi:helix-turn-helix transcriptional regulator [Nocardia brevicatena]|uniref:helix-turn-helix transcriptional regulator n=1 Tax=Nocardia brevicatena TaxID=37327 RepID=UPI001FE1FD0C|nr:helix-turn-helix domain-containing protein [Nocardia brevicatena]
MSHQQERLHQIPGTCERLGVSRSTVYELIKSGELASVKVRGRRLVAESAIQDFIAKVSADQGVA